MTNSVIDFQLVTENIASTLDEKVRMVDGVYSSYNFIVILSAMVVLVLCKQFAPNRLGFIISMMYQNPDTEKMTREWNPLTSFTGFSVAASYIALLALFIQKSVLIFNGNRILYGDFSFFFEMCIFVSAFVLLRYLFININGWAFNTQIASQHQAITHMSMMATMNFILMPLVLILMFYKSKFWVVLGIVVIVVFNILRIAKSFYDFQILTKSELLKIFLYFCTLEIMPISVAFTMAFRLVATDSVL